MKHLHCIALLLLLLLGCSQTEVPASKDATLNVNTVAEEIMTATTDEGEDTAAPTPMLDSAEETAEVKAIEHWIPLFDGESLAGWAMPVYGGDGIVDVQKGILVIGRGDMMTGIRYEKEFPKINYEIRYEARRTEGYDFFASCTFPVKESFCTFINGGWGGGLTGLSNVDGLDASENSTGTYYGYRDNTWHRFRIRVVEDMVQVWITAQDREGNWEEERTIIELETEDRKLSVRSEVNQYKPLGFCTWSSEGQLRNIEYRMIER